MELFQLLKAMVDYNASDLFLSMGAPPNIKIEGATRPLEAPAMKPGEVKALAYSVMNERQSRDFEETLEANLAISAEGIGRFRINAYLQKGEVAMVVRYIKSKIPSFAALNLPPLLGELVMKKRGLVLIVGSAGSGKSTTMAAMVDYRNQNATGHILTIEDPIEFMHVHGKSIVDQREVGIDTHSFDEALRNAMREAPDMIVIGEIRDRQTMQHAVAYAETGHLCISTLHANNANQALERVINFFPEDAHRQLFMDLSLNLQGVISQRLVPGLNQKLVPAIEVMLTSPYVADLIQKGRVDEIKAAMAKSAEIGMRTFDQSLYDLYMDRKISLEEALHHADSRTDLALRVRLSIGKRASDAPDLGLGEWKRDPKEKA
ncbi:MAG: PilT/PilU family type 4a pilus ATPase [Burkholderiales bacterium]